MSYTTPSTIDESASAKAIIAADGDVVFIIGSEDIRVRVFSLFLKKASPVFDKMLSPYFKEGNQLQQLGAIEIALPEDNAEALKTIFAIIHGQNDKVPKAFLPEKLLHIAIAVDKYFCFTPLMFAIDKWLDHCQNTIELNDSVKSWTLAMAALVFKRQGSFAKFTSHLVLHHPGSYVDLVGKDEMPDRAMQFKIAAVLETKRNKLRLHILTEVLKGDSASKKGKHHPDLPRMFMQRAADVSEASILSILEALTRYKNLPPENRWDQACRSEHMFHSIAEKCMAVYEADSSFCLQCAKTDESHEMHATANAGNIASSN